MNGCFEHMPRVFAVLAATNIYIIYAYVIRFRNKPHEEAKNGRSGRDESDRPQLIAMWLRFMEMYRVVYRSISQTNGKFESIPATEFAATDKQHYILHCILFPINGRHHHGAGWRSAEPNTITYGIYYTYSILASTISLKNIGLVLVLSVQHSIQLQIPICR